MIYGIFIGFSLLGMAAAIAVFYSLGAKRRASIPSSFWWGCLPVGAVACFYGLSHSTAPSFAPRITAVGKAYDHVQRGSGRDRYYGFRFLPDNGGEPVDIETTIILPDWSAPKTFNGRTFRVVYLQSANRAMKNEAVDIQILTGEHAGFHDSVDARPVGAWLGIPIGGALVALGYFGLNIKDDDTSTPSDEDAT